MMLTIARIRREISKGYIQIYSKSLNLRLRTINERPRTIGAALGQSTRWQRGVPRRSGNWFRPV
jgi:hypothetical protein